MGGIDLQALHGLIRHLPLPLVLYGNEPCIRYANERFADVFLPGQLENPDMQRLARTPGSGWVPMKLRHRDGRDLVARARAVAVADGVLLVFDDVAGQALARDNERLQKRITELESLSATDPLTGAWNRMQLSRMVDMEISRAMRSGQPVTLILLDVDNFKQVNDVHGHLTGDAVLTEFVGRLRKRMRNTDSLFRWGGDEFVVLATSVGYRGGAALADGLRKGIAAVPFAEVGPITASLGVTEYNEGESAESWFRRTDEALFAAKSEGRNRIHVDRQGSSDVLADRTGAGVLALHWLEAYECGDPTIDAEHRELFDLGNKLIAAAIEQYAEPGMWQAALDAMLARLVQHFQSEEELMAGCGYTRLADAPACPRGSADAGRGAQDRRRTWKGHVGPFGQFPRQRHRRSASPQDGSGFRLAVVAQERRQCRSRGARRRDARRTMALIVGPAPCLAADAHPPTSSSATSDLVR